MLIKTKIDDLVDIIRKNNGATFAKIAKELSWNEESVEKMCLILEKAGFVIINYTVNPMKQPYVKLTEKRIEEKEMSYSGKKLDSYDISAKDDHVRATVSIVYSESEKRPVYEIDLPKISNHTRAYLESLKVELSKVLQSGKAEGDSDELIATRRRVIMEQIGKDLSPGKVELDDLADILLNEMYGLGELEALIGDAKIEEIIINNTTTPVSVYHKRHGWLKTSILMRDEAATRNYAEQIARKVGRQISTLSPILDAHLSGGDRVNATLYPVSAHGNTITMRLFARNPWTIINYLKKDTNAMSIEMSALLWQAMQYEMNVVIAGGTASGKTSALNSLLALIQPFQRIVTIEDTRELMLPSFQWNWVPMVTKIPNPEGLGEVTMLDLVVNALRMRPDRLIMGEIRRKREAEVLFEAMHTGHSVYSTIHADTGSQVIKRLIEPPIEIPPAEVEDIHLLMVQYRDRRKNVRRTLEISEIAPGTDMPEANKIFMWKPRTDTFQVVKPPHRYVEQMNLHTGMTEKEVMDDQKEKMDVLNWMIENKLESVEDVGRVMKMYYGDPSALVKAAQDKTNPSKVL